MEEEELYGRHKRSGEQLQLALGNDLAAALATHVSDYLEEQALAEPSEASIGQLCRLIRAASSLHPDPALQLEIGATVCANYVQQHLGVRRARSVELPRRAPLHAKEIKFKKRLRDRGWMLHAADRKTLQGLVGDGELEIQEAFKPSCMTQRRDGVSKVDMHIIMDGLLSEPGQRGEAFRACFLSEENEANTADPARCEQEGGIPVAVKLVPLTEEEYNELENPVGKAALHQSLYVENLVNGLAYHLVTQGICPNLPVIYRIYFCKDCKHLSLSPAARRLRYREMIAMGQRAGLAEDRRHRTARLLGRGLVRTAPPDVPEERPQPTKLPCIITVNELAEGGSAVDWLSRGPHTEEEWTSFIFQYLAGLVALQRYYGVTHWDTHLGNFLVHPIPILQAVRRPHFEYRLNRKSYFLPLEGNLFVLWDFEMASIGDETLDHGYDTERIEMTKAWGNGMNYDARRPASIILDATDELYVLARKWLPTGARKKLRHILTIEALHADGILEELFSGSKLCSSSKLCTEPAQDNLVGTWDMDKPVQLPKKLQRFVRKLGGRLRMKGMGAGRFIGNRSGESRRALGVEEPAPRRRRAGWMLEADDREALQVLVGAGKLDIKRFTPSCLTQRSQDGNRVVDWKIIIESRIGADSVNGEAFRACFLSERKNVGTADPELCEQEGGLPVAVKLVPLTEKEFNRLERPLGRAALAESLYVENLVNALAYYLVVQGICPNLPVIYRIYLCESCSYQNPALTSRPFRASYPNRYKEMILTGQSPGLIKDRKQRIRRLFAGIPAPPPLFRRKKVEKIIKRNSPPDLLAKRERYTFGDAQRDAVERGAPTELPCMIIVNELAEGGSSLDWLERGRHSEAEWNSFIFQYLAGLAALQKYYNLTHWDTHLGNFLVHPLPAALAARNPYYQYTLDGVTYYLPLQGDLFVVWDFGLVTIPRKATNTRYLSWRADITRTWKDGMNFDMRRPAAVILEADGPPYEAARKQLPPGALSKLRRIANTQNRRARGMLRDLFFSPAYTKLPPNVSIMGVWDMDKPVRLPEELKGFASQESFGRSVRDDNAATGVQSAGRRVRRILRMGTPLRPSHQDLLELAPELETSIGFEIYLPPGRTPARIIGAKNQVHQRITELGVQQLEASQGGKDYFQLLQAAVERAGLSIHLLTPKRLVGGVIWNDVPSRKAEEREEAYPLSFVSRATAEAVVRGSNYRSKSIVQEDRFRYNPTSKMLVRLVTVFVKRKFGLESVDNVIYQSHFGDESAHWHSMAPGKVGITNGEVARRIRGQILTWYKKAMQKGDLFQLGHILHTYQDSFSRSHASRKPADASGVSHITRFQSFASQNTEKHAGADAMEALENSPFRRELLSGTQYFLEQYLLYLNALAKEPDQQVSLQAAQLAAMWKKLEEELIVLDPRVSCQMAGG